MDELKPCPFCNGDEIEMRRRDVQSYQVGKKLKLELIKDDQTPLYYCKKHWMIALPIEEWNTRPIEDQLRARVAELEARLDIGTGNMYDIVCAENENLRAEVVELRNIIAMFIIDVNKRQVEETR